jgi:hypothetical protein
MRGQGLEPAIGTRDGPQRHQWIDVSTRPVHPAALESRLDHDLIGAFGAATANRIASRLKRRVLHLRQAFGEVRDGPISRFSRGSRTTSALDWQVSQRREHLANTIRGVFEGVRLLVQPRCNSGVPMPSTG